MITHIVQFQFKSSLAPERIQETCAHLVSLKDKCLHPITQKPYIKSFKAGKQDSPEGKNNGITHVFVMEFESDQDREYYLTKDPAHLGFVQTLDGLIEKSQVVDFTEGVF
ncbi:hypothetical protein AAWM_10085 [Aspergillus awamori]|uniref:Stress-response A/B barrel domain-containing protein n=1 Tax=Aspergillus awamori TaxID=105351 RepID=A0A401L6T8_ASPAW|nr:hypothetical protein CBS13152_5665 [Aspergillus niger]GCB27200.1 hypothetical protein AAWM_10085 [Aspergillus awamori]KAI2932694.1 hypothetical protein CBS63078_1464 [Aspergillus niger]KAI2979096.1 hypothetical protein CBS147324_647 [Aspergillus niger]KAI3041764.1 hypothetical protein CBS76997_6476 [Aspergillus niger]